jgi:tyrosine-protein phosphatase SIW14
VYDKFLDGKHMISKTLRAIFDAFMVFFLGGIKVLLFYIKQHIFNDSVPNYTRLQGSPLHRGGQPSQNGMNKLSEDGINVIVNLRARNRDHKVLSKILNTHIYSIHVPLFPFRPTESSVVDFLKIFLTEKNIKVFVHCFHGVDRTGLMCAMYRIVLQGWDKASAINEMKRNGFHFWQRSILRFIENSDVEALREKVFSSNPNYTIGLLQNP